MACALGWCPEVFSDSFKVFFKKYPADGMESYETDILVKYKNDNWVKIGRGYEHIADFFGISLVEVEKTFMGCDRESTYHKYYIEDITKKLVVNRLYKLVKKAGYIIK